MVDEWVGVELRVVSAHPLEGPPDPLRGDRLVAEFIELLESYVERRYGAAGRPAPDSAETVPAR